MLTLRASTATLTGTGRAENQDRCLVTDSRVAVADGMGGHPAGAVAAQIAIDTLARLAPPSRTADLAHAFSVANHAIVASARLDAARASMGTTLVALDLLGHGHDRCAVVASVGDSRLYRLRGGALWRVTTDHTWEADLLAAGAAVAAARRGRHVLTRALGAAELVDVDLWELDLDVGDQFLLCSDGVTGALDDEAIAAAWAEPTGVGTVAERIVAAAAKVGSRDDVTAVAATLDTSPEGRPVHVPEARSAGH